MLPYSLFLSLIVLLFSLVPAQAAEPSLVNQAYQKVQMRLNNDSIQDYVLLIKNPERRSYSFVVLLSDKVGLRSAMELKNFWDGWGIPATEGFAPIINLSSDDKKYLTLSIRDRSDDQLNQTLKLRWEAGSFWIIGETKSAAPQQVLHSSEYGDMSGRWGRSIDINWLTGKTIIHCDVGLVKKPNFLGMKISKIGEKDMVGYQQGKQMGLKEYDLSADYLERLDSVCK